MVQAHLPGKGKVMIPSTETERERVNPWVAVYQREDGKMAKRKRQPASVYPLAQSLASCGAMQHLRKEISLTFYQATLQTQCFIYFRS